MKRYLPIIPLLFGLITYAQAQSVSGMVSNGTDRFSGATIKNIGSATRATSDDRGMFSIRVKKGDTLLTSKSFYKTDTSVYNGQPYLNILMHEQKHALHEVTIRATQISPEDIYKQNKQEYKDIYWKGDYSQMMGGSIGSVPGVSTGIIPSISVSLNLDKLYNLLSKEGKDARKMQRTLIRDYHDNVIDHHFTKTMVGDITGYNGPRLDTFMMRYRPTYEFIAKSNDYDVMRYVKEKYALDLVLANELENR